MIEQKIAEIVAIASGVKPCEEERETDLCQINTILACNRCLTTQLIALIAEDQKPMRAMAGLLKDSAEHLRWAYRELSIPEDVQATLDEIDAVLGGVGR